MKHSSHRLVVRLLTLVFTLGTVSSMLLPGCNAENIVCGIQQVSATEKTCLCLSLPPIRGGNSDSTGEACGSVGGFSCADNPWPASGSCVSYQKQPIPGCVLTSATECQCASDVSTLSSGSSVQSCTNQIAGACCVQSQSGTGTVCFCTSSVCGNANAVSTCDVASQTSAPQVCPAGQHQIASCNPDATGGAGGQP
jgi:hypothetical protein